MTKITVDKSLIEQAIEVLTDKCGGRCNAEYNPCHALEVATNLRAALEQPPTQTVVGNSGFDHKIAADFMSGKEINDENVRKFVMASRWAHDDRASLQAHVATLCQDVAARDAEIALLKQSLLDAEALAEPAVEPVYQLRSLGDGRWIDQTKESYNYNLKHGHKVRVLYISPPPPADVPLLSDFEISDIFQKSNKPGSSHGDFARAVEQAVRHKAGLK